MTCRGAVRKGRPADGAGAGTGTPGQLELILVRVAAALTCGTDLKVYRRGYHAMMLQPPIPFGHEMAGTVVAAVGPGCFRAL